MMAIQCRGKTHHIELSLYLEPDAVSLQKVVVEY